MNRIAKLVALLVSLVLLAAGALITSTAADAAPAYRKMTKSEISVARSVLKLLNRERAEQGLRALKVTRTLTRGAATHNATMARSNVVSHQLSGERDFVARDRAAGWKANCAGGENIGVSSDLTRGGALRLQKLMYNEVAPNDGHRQNILGRRYTHVGIAVTVDKHNDKLWLTVDFGQRSC